MADCVFCGGLNSVVLGTLSSFTKLYYSKVCRGQHYFKYPKMLRLHYGVWFHRSLRSVVLVHPCIGPWVHGIHCTWANYFAPHSSHWIAVAAILFLEIQWALSPPLYLNKSNRTDCTNEGHKLTCWIRCMWFQVFSPCVDLCLIPNELLYMT